MCVYQYFEITNYLIVINFTLKFRSVLASGVLDMKIQLIFGPINGTCIYGPVHSLERNGSSTSRSIDLKYPQENVTFTQHWTILSLIHMRRNASQKQPANRRHQKVTLERQVSQWWFPKNTTTHIATSRNSKSIQSVTIQWADGRALTECINKCGTQTNAGVLISSLLVLASMTQTIFIEYYEISSLFQSLLSRGGRQCLAGLPAYLPPWKKLNKL